MIEDYLKTVEGIETMRWSGHVTEMAGLVIASAGPAAGVGDFCEIICSNRNDGPASRIRAQVVGFRDGRLLLMPLEDTGGVQLGDTVIARPEAARLPVGQALLGRVLDGFGRPLDRQPAIETEETRDLYAVPPGPLERVPIHKSLVTGVRAIDSLMPFGEGQRIGIFGGSGVGKSTLLGAMSRQNSADVSVIALIGERNREVREFIEHDLGPAGLARSVVVVATSDTPAPLRI